MGPVIRAISNNSDALLRRETELAYKLQVAVIGGAATVLLPCSATRGSLQEK